MEMKYIQQIILIIVYDDITILPQGVRESNTKLMGLLCEAVLKLT